MEAWSCTNRGVFLWPLSHLDPLWAQLVLSYDCTKRFEAPLDVFSTVRLKVDGLIHSFVVCLDQLDLIHCNFLFKAHAKGFFLMYFGRV